MRICFFNRSYWPDLAATGQLLTELAEDLVRVHGHTVCVVAGPPLVPNRSPESPQRAKFPFRRERHNGVEILRAAATTFRPRGFASRASNYLSYFVNASFAALRLGEPDVVVAFTDPPIIGLVAARAARRAGVPFVFVSQDVFPEVARLLDGVGSRSVDRVLGRVSRDLLGRADRVVALGRTMRRRLVDEKGAAPDDVVVIHNWADGEAIRPLPKDQAFARERGLVDRFVVMHSGNMGLSQDLDMVIEAAARLGDLPDVVFALVGDGARRAALEEAVGSRGLSNVRFFPYQPKERLHESFACADVFIVSLKRGLAGYIVPSKLYGILAAGRPYVAAVEERCEVAEITRDHDCGLLVEPGDPRALAAAIRRLYDDLGLKQTLGRNARVGAVNFDRRRQVGRYHDLFEELVDGS